MANVCSVSDVATWAIAITRSMAPATTRMAGLYLTQTNAEVSVGSKNRRAKLPLASTVTLPSPSDAATGAQGHTLPTLTPNRSRAPPRQEFRASTLSPVRGYL